MLEHELFSLLLGLEVLDVLGHSLHVHEIIIFVEVLSEEIEPWFEVLVEVLSHLGVPQDELDDVLLVLLLEYLDDALLAQDLDQPVLILVQS